MENCEQFILTHKEFIHLLMSCKEHICKEWHYGISKLELDIKKINIKRTEGIINRHGAKIKFTKPVKVDKWFDILSKGYFPVYSNLRTHNQIAQSEKADILHDLYGHAPYLVDYNFNLACEFFSMNWTIANSDCREKLLKLWFYMMEFSVVRQNEKLHAFGGGLITSNFYLKKFIERSIDIKKYDFNEVLNSNVSPSGSPEKLFYFESVNEIYLSLLNGVNNVIQKKH